MKRYLALPAAALLSAGVFAQYPEEPARTPFEMLDTDQSATISAQEAKANSMLARNFVAADRDADGVLDRGEFKLALSSTPPPRQAVPVPDPPPPEPY